MVILISKFYIDKLKIKKYSSLGELITEKIENVKPLF